MRTYVLQDRFGIDHLRITESPQPRLGARQVLLRMRAWSLNYRDLMVVQGRYNPKLPLPFIPLSDGVGEIVEVGTGVDASRIGERVAGLFMQRWMDGRLTDEIAKSALGAALPGIAAEYVVLDEAGVVPLPDYLSFEEGATLPCAAVTAWRALETLGALQSTDSILIQGTGGVSLFALQFARRRGARVIATSGSSDKLARVMQMGADAGINYRETPAWGDRVRVLTKGIGVDHVIEVGGGGTMAESLRAVRTGGRISVIGILAGLGSVDILPVLMRSLHIQGIFVGSRTDFVTMCRAMTEHKIHPIIDQVFSFEQLPQALRHMESAGHFGKIVIRVD